jgi:hypothetical protein
MDISKLKYDLRGKRIGMLKVLEPLRINGQLKWEVICDCGNKRFCLTTDLRKEKVKSCGCNRANNVSISKGVDYSVTEMECKVCNEIKPVEEFYKRTDGNRGYRLNCKDCYLNKKKVYGEINSQRRKDYMKQYRIDNPDQFNNWVENNYERYLNNTKNWRIKNPEKSKLHKKNNFKKRLKNDPKFRLRHNIRKLISSSLSKKGYTKKSLTREILGIHYNGFYQHIENQFNGGMSWDNRKLWDIDHIIPVSLGRTEEEIIKLNHYSNLRPLWKKDNRDKSNKILDEYKHLIVNYIDNPHLL